MDGRLSLEIVFEFFFFIDINFLQKVKSGLDQNLKVNLDILVSNKFFKYAEKYFDNNF